MNNYGEEISGHLHSTNASSGVAIPMYLDGSSTLRVLAADEYLTITDYSIVSAAGGDVSFHVGATAATPGAGETVARGTVAANGGLAHNFIRTGRTPPKGGTPYLKAPSGDVDIVFTGRISK